MNLKRFILFTLTISAVLPSLWGQDSTSVYMQQNTSIHQRMQLWGVGMSSVLDTYISPRTYKGEEIRYISQTELLKSTRFFNPLWQHQASISYVSNAVKTNKEVHALYHLTFSLQHSISLHHSPFMLQVGPMVDTALGFIYNPQNSNNPAQAIAHLNVGVFAQSSYAFKVGKMPFSLHYQCSAPLIGVMFSPNYGQSYYETFSKGVYNHNIVCTTPFNRPSFYHLLSLNLSLSNTTLQLCYAGNHLQSEVNKLRSAIHSHSIMVGFVKHFQLIRQKP